MSKKSNWSMKDLIDRGLTEKEPGIFKKSEPDAQSLERREFLFNKALKTNLGRPNLEEVQKEIAKEIKLQQVVFIHGNVPSKKNGMCFSCRDGKPVKYPAQKMLTYEEISKNSWIANQKKFTAHAFKYADQVLNIEFTFVRDTKKIFDFLGPAETVQDYMVKYGYIKDDNITIIKPSFGDPIYNKKRPGVYIKILNGQ